MSRFRAGMDVYVGFCPDHSCSPESRPFRCRIGVITRGPVEGSTLFPPNRLWFVNIDGTEIKVAEYLLSPFNPPSESETRESEREVKETA